MTKIMYKLLLIGNPGSGKTGLINAYIQGNYKREYISGLRIEFYTKNEKMPNGTSVTLHVHDSLISLEKFHKYPNFLLQALSNTNLVLLCYDLNNSEASQNISEWIHLIRSTPKGKGNICLVGCKSDLPMSVDLTYAKDITETYNLEFHVMTSAKEMKNVNYLFQHCADWCYQRAEISQLNSEKENK